MNATTAPDRPAQPGASAARSRWASLRVRLTLLLAVALLPAVLLLLYAGYESGRRARAEADNELLRLAGLLAAGQGQLLADTRNLMAVIAQFPEVQPGQAAACTERLAQVAALYPLYSGLGVVARDGDVYCLSRPSTAQLNLADRQWFQLAMADNDFAVGGYQENRPSGTPAIGLGYPVRDAAGQPQAVVLVGLDLAALNTAAAAVSLPPDAELLMFDFRGTVVAYLPEPEGWLGQYLPDAPLVQRALTGHSGVAPLPGLDEAERVYAFAPLPGPAHGRLFLALGRPVGAMYAAADSTQSRNLTSIALLVALALVAIWQGSRRLILRPLDQLLQTTRRLTAGDLAARTRLDPAAGEVGQLAFAFDHLAETLEQRNAERQQAAEALRQSELHYRRLVELSPDTIFVQQAGRLVYVNSAGARLLGQELVGQAVDHLVAANVAPDVRPRLLAALAAVEAGTPLPYLEVRWQAAGAQPLVLELAAAPTEHAGRPAALVILRDITTRLLLEQRTQTMAEATQVLAEAGPHFASALDRVARLGGELLGDPCVLRVLSPDGAYLETAGVFDPNPAQLPALRAALAQVTLPSDGLSGRIIQSGEPLFLPAVAPAEAATVARLEPRAFFEHYPVYGVIGVPLRCRQRVVGTLSTLRTSPGLPYSLEDLDFVQTLADRVALAVDNAQLYAAETIARQAAQQSAARAEQEARRVARLQNVTAAVSAALTPAQVVDVMLQQGIDTLGADAGALVLLDEDGATLRVTKTVNFPQASVLPSFPLAAEAPAAVVVRTGQPIWIEAAAEFAARYPRYLPERSRAGFEAVAYLPLEVEGQRLGAMAINFAQARQFAPEERELLVAVARQGAQALARTRRFESEREARAAAEAARQRLAFLAEASRVLAASLEIDATLQAVARLALPHLGDYALIYHIDPGGAVRTAALVHHDPARQALLREMDQCYSPTPGDPSTLLGQAVMAREPRVINGLTPEQLAAASPDPRVGELLQALQVEAVAHLPLAGRGPVWGVLSLVFAGSGRRFSPADVSLAQEIARRAGLALENAQLYAEAQQLNAELEQRVRRRTAQLEAANATLEAEVAERLRVEAALEQSSVQLRQLNAYVQAAREEERGRISREIHDELGGSLTGLKMDVARIRKALDKPGGDAAVARLEELSRLIDDMVQTVRRIATELRPALLDDFGLEAALEWQLQEFEKRAGLACTLTADVGPVDWDPEGSTAVFRAFQEALTNVARHSHGSRVDVTLTRDGDQLVLRVQDNGRGIRTGELAGRNSLGLAGMRERAALLGGDVEIVGSRGHGTTVVIKVPWNRLTKLRD